MLKTNIKRLWLISDLHFGVRTNSLEWLEIHKDYFYNFFIPLLKQNKKPDDALFVLGDVFESRQTINILILNEAIKVFTELGKILPVYIIVGNHDTYRKFTTDVNSTIVFKTIENVTVYDEVEMLESFNGKKLLMMPWQEGPEQELKVIDGNSADYLFCHTNFMGIKFNKKVEVEEGLDVKTVSKFQRVYSGHIHLTQNIQNVCMVGCVFPLTRNDIGDIKKVVVLDLETGKEAIIKNTYSPKFIKYKVDGLLNMTFEAFEKEIQNNFVDIVVDNTWVTMFPFSILMDSVSGYKKLNYVLSSLQKDYDELDEDVLDGNMKIEDLTEFYINNLNYSEDFKKSLLEATARLYKKAKKFIEEKTLGPEN